MRVRPRCPVAVAGIHAAARLAEDRLHVAPGEVRVTAEHQRHHAAHNRGRARRPAKRRRVVAGVVPDRARAIGRDQAAGAPAGRGGDDQGRARVAVVRACARVGQGRDGNAGALVGVSVIVAVVTGPPAVAGRPHEDAASAPAAVLDGIGDRRGRQRPGSCHPIGRWEIRGAPGVVHDMHVLECMLQRLGLLLVTG